MNNRLTFKCLAKTEGGARTGLVEIGPKKFNTPAFMPVATLAAVRTMTADDVKEVGAEIILANALHLAARPGVELLQQAGGLHKFMNWEGPILTDSGGYQVFSLAEIRKIRETGVEFKSPFDGQTFEITPESSVDLQRRMGSDIVMAFDECPPYPSPEDKIEEAIGRTDRWLSRCVAEAEKDTPINLFGIVQGGIFPKLRRESLQLTLEYPLQGLAIGGLSVGEEAEYMYEVLEDLMPLMPKDRPRYLMGVGTPENLLQAIRRGVDMFDCVLPTRNARNGTLYTSAGKINITNAAFRQDQGPLDEDCKCMVCQKYSRAYVRHLFTCKEMLAYRLSTWHNLAFYQQLMRDCRQALSAGDFESFAKDRLERWQAASAAAKGSG